MNTSEQRPLRAGEKKAVGTFRTPEAIQHVIPNLQAEVRKHYVVEWGARVTDGALVFHFFPPLIGGSIGKWPDDSTMDKRLERALPETFDPNRLTAGFEESWDSFFVIAGGYASSLDIRLLVKRFLDRIDQDN